jgi:hypothetical protein
MPSICQNHGYSWEEYNFQNYTDSKGQGAPEHVQGGGKPFKEPQSVFKEVENPLRLPRETKNPLR